MPEKIFEALGDPVRRLVLELLAGGELSTGEIVDAVHPHAPISQPAVSQHLRVLREAGLVVVRAEGTRRYYAADPATVEHARAWLAGIMDPLHAIGQPLDALATEVARGARARRGGITQRANLGSASGPQAGAHVRVAE